MTHPAQGRHPFVDLPTGAAALACLARAGLHLPEPILGVIATSAGPRPVTTLHLNPSCTLVSGEQARIAVLDGELLAGANAAGTYGVLACYCQPATCSYGDWIHARSELAALLAVLDYVEIFFDEDDRPSAGAVGLLRLIVADFDETGPSYYAGTEQMTREALEAVRDACAALVPDVDVDNVLYWSRFRRPEATGGDRIMRAMVTPSLVTFDSTCDPTENDPTTLALLGAYGWLERDGASAVWPRSFAVHVPLAVAEYAGAQVLGPAPQEPEDASLVFDLRERAEQLARNWPVESKPAGSWTERVTAAVGVLTDVPA